MIEIVKTRCDNGIVRYPRINAIKKRDKKEDKNTFDIPAEALNFEKVYQNTSLKFTGRIYQFCSRQWTKRKLLLVLKTLENLRIYRIEQDLFLNFIFERQKTYSRSIWPSNISSIKSIREYQEWTKQFVTKNSIREMYKENTLEEIILKNHKKYIYYKEKLNWSDEMIFRLKGSEFDPFYLFSDPGLSEEYHKYPQALTMFKDKFDQVLNFVHSEPREAFEFLEVARRIKCQNREHPQSLILSFNQR